MVVSEADLIGHSIRIGEVECRGEERCEPCQHLAGLLQTPVVLRGLLHSGMRAGHSQGRDDPVGGRSAADGSQAD